MITYSLFVVVLLKTLIFYNITIADGSQTPNSSYGENKLATVLLKLKNTGAGVNVRNHVPDIKVLETIKSLG
jgi:hypothetical protein